MSLNAMIYYVRRGKKIWWEVGFYIVCIFPDIPILQDPRGWMLSASLLLGISQRIPWSLIDNIDSIYPFPSHKYLDRMPAVLFFSVPNGWWLWWIKLVFMFLKTAIWKKMKQGRIFKFPTLLSFLLAHCPSNLVLCFWDSLFLLI